MTSLQYSAETNSAAALLMEFMNFPSSSPQSLHPSYESQSLASHHPTGSPTRSPPYDAELPMASAMGSDGAPEAASLSNLNLTPYEQQGGHQTCEDAEDSNPESLYPDTGSDSEEDGSVPSNQYEWKINHQTGQHKLQGMYLSIALRRGQTNRAKLRTFSTKWIQTIVVTSRLSICCTPDLPWIMEVNAQDQEERRWTTTTPPYSTLTF